MKLWYELHSVLLKGHYIGFAIFEITTLLSVKWKDLEKLTLPYSGAFYVYHFLLEMQDVLKHLQFLSDFRISDHYTPAYT